MAFGALDSFSRGLLGLIIAWLRVVCCWMDWWGVCVHSRLLRFAAGWVKQALMLPLAAIILAVAATAAGQAMPPPAGIIFQNVNFTSGPALSGEITLYGTLVTAANASATTPMPGVVMVAGSGPNDRWETLGGGMAPFWYISTNLAARGFAVLVYDKRSCTAGVHAECRNVICTTPGATGCVNVTMLGVTDFTSDAVQAVKFLLTVANVKQQNVTIIGHSQGCDIVPIVASRVSQIGNVVLLAGAGVPVDQILRDQMQTQLPLYQQALAYWEQQPVSAQRNAEINAINGTIQGADCTIDYAVQQLNLLRNGIVKPTDVAVICPSGVFWSGGYNIPSNVYCPAACGNGICSLNQVDAQCKLNCHYGAAVGACQPVQFYWQWLEISEPDARLATWKEITGRVLIFNSWQDLLVTPATFAPLHKMLQSLNNFELLQINTMHNVTHDLTDIGSSYPGVTSKIIDPLDEFLQSV